uniref:WWE domain-containing protein n=2 Tax=Denticeps clupeoides TaxID=299321 RepID=A0AAY4DUM8_9TELE
MARLTENSGGLFQSSSASRQFYEWQLFDGCQWKQIRHDDVIEAHYCQPGAKGITIHSTLGSIYIDFDKLEAQGRIRVRRQTFFSEGQAQEIGWYFKDSSVWQEYGLWTAGRTCSVNSSDLEEKYRRNSQATFMFTVGRTSYKMDFAAMTQTNMTTRITKSVRRRPKLNSTLSENSSGYSLPLSAGYLWEFMAEEGQWTEYQKPHSSLDSDDIEQQYQLNPQGQISFKTRSFSYTLDFNRMLQANDRLGTQRAVRRIQKGSQQTASSSGVRWQFKDIGGVWKDYVKNVASVSSQDIENEYQKNPHGRMHFGTSSYNYLLDFSNMTQTNLNTQTSRQVRRI